MTVTESETLPQSYPNLGFTLVLYGRWQQVVRKMSLEESRRFLRLQRHDTGVGVLELWESVLHVLLSRLLLIQVVVEKVNHFLHPCTACQHIAQF